MSIFRTNTNQDDVHLDTDQLLSINNSHLEYGSSTTPSPLTSPITPLTPLSIEQHNKYIPQPSQPLKLPSDWELKQNYRYQNYYLHKPTSITTWFNPITNQIENNWFCDEFDLPDYDLVDLMQSKLNYIDQSQTLPKSPYYPYYHHQFDPPDISPRSSLHPLYYTSIINQYNHKFDPNGTIMKTMQNDIINNPTFATKHIIQPNKYDRSLSWYQLCCGTFIRAELLCLFSFILWFIIIALFTGWIFYFRHKHWSPTELGLSANDLNIITNNIFNTTQLSTTTFSHLNTTIQSLSFFNTMSYSLHILSNTIIPNTTTNTTLNTTITTPIQKDSQMLSFGLSLISGVLVYAIYLFVWVWPGLFAWLCCGQYTSGKLVKHDQIIESFSNYSNNNNNNPELQYNPTIINEVLTPLITTQPKLWFEIECSHLTSKKRTFFNCFNCYSSYNKEITYLATKSIPIITSNDISPSIESYIDILNKTPVSHMTMNIYHHFKLHPLQEKYIQAIRKQLHVTHSYRDTDIRITLKYQLNESILTLSPTTLLPQLPTQQKPNYIIKLKKYQGWLTTCIDWVLFSRLTFFILLHFCLYLPLIMIYRHFARQIPYVNIKYIILGQYSNTNDDIKNGLVDHVLINRPRAQWQWDWAE